MGSRRVPSTKVNLFHRSQLLGRHTFFLENFKPLDPFVIILQ